MTNLLTWHFWFTLRPESMLLSTQKLFLGFLIILVLLAFLIAVGKRKAGIYRGFFKKLYGFCFSNAIIGFILFFCSYEVIPFFSARFWLAIWFISMLVWLFFIFRKLKIIPKQKQQQEEDKELKKYLP